MKNLGKRYERECCTQAEQLTDHICAMEKPRFELAYQRLVELLESAQRRRVELSGISQSA